MSAKKSFRKFFFTGRECRYHQWILEPESGLPKNWIISQIEETDLVREEFNSRGSITPSRGGTISKLDFL